ncbi:hypothetical protein CWI39_0441p0010 [Hamiltosporidium magnivora]|uniref:Uncharacterized protein n=1 Tax=Hamiltosporidium magnivora TaxID=148818 RepID=A0A4Q9LGW8_9MICR|nr:hypothetical protein CWI39_0441p0010 [Hamiltosporidium magnivora]
MNQRPYLANPYSNFTTEPTKSNLDIVSLQEIGWKGISVLKTKKNRVFIVEIRLIHLEQSLQKNNPLN